MVVRSAADTAPAAFEMLVARWRSMSPVERAVLADRLSVDVATLAEAAIRAQDPGLTELDLRHELARRRYGATLADAAYRRPPDA